MYTIELYYVTGDSFHTEEITQCIEFEWENLDIVKKNLQRIKNHYDFYNEYGNYNLKPKNIIIPEGVMWDKKYNYYRLLLLDDNGKEIPFSAFWVGYFETLFSATIVLSDTNDFCIHF